jgi:hypothetical protein
MAAINDVEPFHRHHAEAVFTLSGLRGVERVFLSF